MKRRLPRGILLASLGTSAALVGVLYLVSSFSRVSFVPFDLADTIIKLTPGDIATTGIETLGPLAKILLKASSILLFMALCMGFLLLSLWLVRGRRWAGVGLAAILALALMAGLQFQTINQGGALAYGLLLALAAGWGLANSWIVQRLATLQDAASDAEAATAAQQLARERRMFLLRSGSVMLGIAAGSRALAELVERPAVQGAGVRLPTAMPTAPLAPTATVSPSATPPPGAPAAPATAAPAATPTAAPVAFAAPAGVRAKTTEQQWLYRIAVPTRDPEVDAASWNLSIGGAVAKPFSLTYDELLALPRVDQTSTLTCISNDVGDYLIGNCNWNGVRLVDLLDRAGVEDGVVDIVFRSTDDYSDSLPLAIARDPHTIVAYGTDGDALMVSHGFPARLIIPGKYGEKNVKWLASIEAVREDYQGYWQQRGWTDDATVYTTSVIDTGNPRTMKEPLQRENGNLALGGIGFAGNRGISKVEIQIDGAEWLPVQLDDAANDITWRLWRYDWLTPTPGKHMLAVRATDGRGELQTSASQPTHPLGATGLHMIEVTVA